MEYCSISAGMLVSLPVSPSSNSTTVLLLLRSCTVATCHPKSGANLLLCRTRINSGRPNSNRSIIHSCRLTMKKKETVAATVIASSSGLNVVSTLADPAQAELTWQIVVGALAGLTPFVVAGIEFSKRIVAQKRCVACGGSGLVLRDKYYFRCPNCGGFLPWQSWKRFFSG